MSWSFLFVDLCAILDSGDAGVDATWFANQLARAATAHLNILRGTGAAAHTITRQQPQAVRNRWVDACPCRFQRDTSDLTFTDRDRIPTPMTDR